MVFACRDGRMQGARFFPELGIDRIAEATESKLVVETSTMYLLYSFTHNITLNLLIMMSLLGSAVDLLEAFGGYKEIAPPLF